MCAVEPDYYRAAIGVFCCCASRELSSGLTLVQYGAGMEPGFGASVTLMSLMDLQQPCMLIKVLTP